VGGGKIELSDGGWVIEREWKSLTERSAACARIRKA